MVKKSPQVKTHSPATAGDQVPRGIAPWVGSYFGVSYRAVYRHLVDEADDLRQSVQWIASVLDWNKKCTVLDLACGYGRHLRHLAALPGRFIGLDIVEGQLLQAKRDLGVACPPLVQGDMHQLPLRSGSIEVALMLFNSFGYRDFDIPADNVDAEAGLLRELARTLSARGKVLLEIPNREHVRLAVAEEPRTEIDEGDRHLIEEWRIGDDGCTLIGLSCFVQGGETERLPFAVRLFSLTEFTHMATQAGLRPVQTWGDLHGSRYHPRDSQQLVIQLEKIS